MNVESVVERGEGGCRLPSAAACMDRRVDSATTIDHPYGFMDFGPRDLLPPSIMLDFTLCHRVQIQSRLNAPNKYVMSGPRSICQVVRKVEDDKIKGRPRGYIRIKREGLFMIFARVPSALVLRLGIADRERVIDFSGTSPHSSRKVGERYPFNYHVTADSLLFVTLRRHRRERKGPARFQVITIANDHKARFIALCSSARKWDASPPRVRIVSR